MHQRTRISARFNGLGPRDNKAERLLGMRTILGNEGLAAEQWSPPVETKKK
jgi:hypothetical protein